MGVKSNVNDFMREIEESINAELEKLRFEIVRQLSIIGERCVNEARSLPSLSRDNPAAKYPHQPNYIDDSGNLRSSIGYVIIVDGEIQALSGFESIGGAKEGAESGKEYARSLVANYPTGYALIVVAGMNYAEYVAANGYDVLDSAELIAEKMCKEIKKV